MKIKELNIGNWVLINSEPARALRLTQVGHSTFKGVSGQMYRVIGSSISPLPITPEILEKNGFVRKDKYQFVNIDMLSTVEKYGNKYYDYHNIYKKGKTYRPTCVEADNIRYVHELQHAMRLAGIEKEIEV